LQRGCRVDDRGIIPDDAGALMETLVSAAADNDLVLTTGGASVGAEDHLKQLVRKRGYLEFWRLRMKPGKPVGLGDVDDCPILILPGNPVAAAFAFHFLGQVLIAALSGDRVRVPTALRLPLAAPAAKTTDRLEILAARLVAVAGGVPAVDILPVQGSASHLSLALAEGWAQIPAGDTAQRSGFVDYFPIGF
ncbi:molybdopterin-binding protein, partial [Nostoc sp. NIES-2111]